MFSSSCLKTSLAGRLRVHLASGRRTRRLVCDWCRERDSENAGRAMLHGTESFIWAETGEDERKKRPARAPSVLLLDGALVAEILPEDALDERLRALAVHVVLAETCRRNSPTQNRP